MKGIVAGIRNEPLHPWDASVFHSVIASTNATQIQHNDRKLKRRPNGIYSG